MPDARKLQTLRRQLWEASPLCHWCGSVTTWEAPHDGRLTEAAATVDHLFSRLHPQRKVRAPGANAVVLACMRCNRERNRVETKTLGRLLGPNPPRQRVQPTPGIIGRPRALVYTTTVGAW